MIRLRGRGARYTLIGLVLFIMLLLPVSGLAEDVSNGRDIFSKKAGCIACHSTVVDGKMVGGVLCPNLSRVAERRNPETFKQAIMKPLGDLMPKNFGTILNKKEIDDLVAFLMTQKGKEPAPPKGAPSLDRGKWLFQKKGCFLCHGASGKGGIPNANYIKDSVPALNTLAERMGLIDREGANAIQADLGSNTNLDSLNPPPFPRFNVFLVQYKAIKDVIQKGSRAGKKNPAGPQPPLNMPSWKNKLSDKDMRDLIVYLLSLQTWEE